MKTKQEGQAPTEIYSLKKSLITSEEEKTRGENKREKEIEGQIEKEKDWRLQ